jgi:hypothetical protein
MSVQVHPWTRRYASVETIALGRANAGGRLVEHKSLGSRRLATLFADGARALPFQDILDAYAERYQISRRPQDYLLETIVGLVAEKPNDNKEAFPETQLLRWEPRFQNVSYRTFAGKPHFLDHQADDPTKALGLIVDATYNFDVTVPETCEVCGASTKDPDKRDVTGTRCGACNHVVVLRPVELLNAIDASKDARYADRVARGEARHGSMGCDAFHATCSVCGNVSRSDRDICSHAQKVSKGGNKGRFYDLSSGTPRIITGEETARIMRRAGLKFVPTNFDRIRHNASGTHIALANEALGEIGFAEYSRVGVPAEGLAEQKEILKMSKPKPKPMKNTAPAPRARAAQLEVDEKPTKPTTRQALEVELTPGSDPLIVKPPQSGAVPAAPDPAAPDAPDAMPPAPGQPEPGEQTSPGGEVPPTNGKAPTTPPSLEDMGLTPVPGGTTAASGMDRYSRFKAARSQDGRTVLLDGAGEAVVAFVDKSVSPKTALAALERDGLTKLARAHDVVLAPRFAQMADDAADEETHEEHEARESPEVEAREHADDPDDLEMPMEGVEGDEPMLSFEDAGFSTEEAAAWQEVGVDDADSARTLAEHGITAEMLATAEPYAMPAAKGDEGVDLEGDGLGDEPEEIPLGEAFAQGLVTLEEVGDAVGVEIEEEDEIEHAGGEDEGEDPFADMDMADEDGSAAPVFDPAMERGGRGGPGRSRGRPMPEDDDETMALAREAAFAGTKRALHIVARRVSASLVEDDLPIVQAMVAYFSEPRDVGGHFAVDALPEDVARRIAHDVLSVALAPTIDALFAEAGAFTSGAGADVDGYLIRAEQDARRLAARSPEVTSRRTASASPQMIEDLVAKHVRDQLARSSLTNTPSRASAGHGG